MYFHFHSIFKEIYEFCLSTFQNSEKSCLFSTLLASPRPFLFKFVLHFIGWTSSGLFSIQSSRKQILQGPSFFKIAAVLNSLWIFLFWWNNSSDQSRIFFGKTTWLSLKISELQLECPVSIVSLKFCCQLY